MRRAFVYLLGAVTLTAGVLMAATLRTKLPEAAPSLKIINADTGEAPASAIYQRFARRRRAAESMQRTLRNVALAESLFVADSGYATIGPFLGRYAYAHESTFRLQILLQADRWVALA